MRRDLPPYVRIKRGGSGRTYLYYERHGKRTRLPDFDHPNFWAEYARAGRGLPRTSSTRNWRALVALYRADERYTKLAPRTKQDYEPALVFLAEKWGDLDPVKLKRSQVIAVMKANSYRKANDFKAVVSRCLEVAKDMDWLVNNVAASIPPAKPKSRLNRQPWPRDLIEAFRGEAPHGTVERTVFELALGTGQRIGDVLSLRWSDLQDGGFRVVQGKTGAELWIPLTPTLAHCLSKTPRAGIFIVDADGTRATYQVVAKKIRRIRQAIGAERYDIHALRHTAAWELYEAGCTDDEVKAITGHSAVQMLRLYGGAARQRQHAKSAQEKRK